MPWLISFDFRFDLDTMNIGVVGFSTIVLNDTEILLGSIKNYAQLYINLMNKVKPSTQYSSTATGTAINYMREKMFLGFDEEKEKVCVLLSDGRSMDPGHTLSVSFCQQLWY